MRYLSDHDLLQTRPAETVGSLTPIPTQIVSNGEFAPLPQTSDQLGVERRVLGAERSNLRYGYVAKAGA